MVRAKERSPARLDGQERKQAETREAAPAIPQRIFQKLAPARHPARVAGLLTAVVVLPIYLSTVAPDLSWDHYGADGPELITAAVTLGVPHPPGYPTYVLLGKVVSLLPFGSIAFRFNLFSAFCVVGATALLAVTTYTWLQHSEIRQAPDMHRLGDTQPQSSSRISGRAFWAALTAGFTFALLPLVWRQALITEVYGLNLLVVSALLWSLFRAQLQRKGWLTGLFMGIGVTTHLTSLLFAPVAAYLTPRRDWGRFVAGVFLGLLPLFAVPLLAQSGSPLVWGEPVTLRGWWWLVSGQLYQPNVFSLPPSQWFTRLVALTGEATFWFYLVGVVSIAVSLKAYTRQQRWAVVVMLTTSMLFGIYAFTYRTVDALVFLLPALLVLNILLARWWWVAGPLALFLPLTLVVLNFSAVNLNGQVQARTLAESVIREAPRDALLFTTGDETTFTLWYLQYVEGQRPDIIIVDENLFAFDWYRNRLQSRYPNLNHLQQDDLPGFRQRNTQDRPWCKVRLSPEMNAPAQFDCVEE